MTILLLAPVLSCDENQVVDPNESIVVWSRLTDPAQISEPYYPEWRGDSIVFEYGSSVGALWLGVMPEDASSRTLFTEGGPASDLFPRWVTDDVVIYSSNKAGAGNYDLWYKVLSTNTDRRFTRFPEREFGPAPRPGRPSVAYTEGTEPLKGRIVLLADTAAVPLERTYLTPDTMVAGEADWSPNGNELCFSAEEPDGSRHIWLAELADTVVTSLRQLTRGSIYDFTPRFSPDGMKIVFTSNRSGRSGVWWVSVDGEDFGFGLISLEDPTYTEWVVLPDEEPVRVLRPVEVYSPSWSPDGQKIIVSSNGRGVSVNGRGARALWVLTNLPF